MIGQPVLPQAAENSPGPEKGQWPGDIPSSYGLLYLLRVSGHGGA